VTPALREARTSTATLKKRAAFCSMEVRRAACASAVPLIADTAAFIAAQFAPPVVCVTMLARCTSLALGAAPGARRHSSYT
jgi:hypothetical protein